MWGRTKDRLAALEAGLERILAKLERADERPSGQASGDAIANLLGTSIKSQTDLVATLGDIAVRSAARRMGIRGGLKRAETGKRRADGRFLPTAHRTECRLCADPMVRNPSIAEIQQHRIHEATNAVRSAPVNPVESDEPRSSGAQNNGRAEPD